MIIWLIFQIHEEEFGESANGWVNGSFYLDPSLGRDTVLAVYFYSRDLNTLVGDIHLTAPDGVQHRGISETSMASLYVTPLTAIEKSGVWMYSFDRRSISHQSHFVKVTSKSRLRSSMPHYQRGPISAQLKIVAPVERDAPFILLATVTLNYFSYRLIRPVLYPIVIHLKVKSGEMPVLDARVRATIQFTGGESNQDSSNTVVIDLLDNGNSDPDITKGDGVYSRYFGKYFRGAGTYSVSLSVDAMNGMAYTIRPYPIATGKTSTPHRGPPPPPPT